MLQKPLSFLLAKFHGDTSNLPTFPNDTSLLATQGIVYRGEALGTHRKELSLHSGGLTVWLSLKGCPTGSPGLWLSRAGPALHCSLKRLAELPIVQDGPVVRTLFQPWSLGQGKQGHVTATDVSWGLLWFPGFMNTRLPPPGCSDNSMEVPSLLEQIL